jgi:glycosyltransferase involved in cell wall biosynthesis
MRWGEKADVIVSHSGHDKTPLANTNQPIVHAAHGRPLSTWEGERHGKAPGLTYQTQRKRRERYCCAVTFWPEYEPYLRNIWGPKPVYVVTPPVDAEYWTPGKTDYTFRGQKGRVNVVMLDPWSREDSSPYHCIHAFCLFQRIVEGAKLHLFAWDGNKRGLSGLTNLLGKGGGIIHPWAQNVREILRAADLLITPHRIYTRSIREAMSCGVQVVSGRDCHPEDIEAFALLMCKRLEHPQPVRKMAQAIFDPDCSARQMRNVLARHMGVPSGH